MALAEDKVSEDKVITEAVKCAKLLVEAGVSIPAAGLSNGRSLLTETLWSKENAVPLLEYFLSMGAKVDARDGNGIAVDEK